MTTMPDRLRAAWANRAGTRDGRAPLWRVAVPAVYLLAGVLFITSAYASDGTDLRAGRYGDLGGLVAQQADEVDELRAEANELSAEVEKLSARVDTAGVEEAQERTEELRRPAGLVPVEGPGLTVTLTDAPEDVVESADIDLNRLVVHQQDIQAVVNAMWASGAEAMTIQGQRVISTTGIKCVGNTVVLHDVPYSPPYVITAVGDPDAMLTGLNANPYIKIYQQYVERYQLGWEVDIHRQVALPGYDGSLDLDYAQSPAVDNGTADDEI